MMATQQGFILTHFILIHGGAHAGWCWDKVVPLLKGHPQVASVNAIDLPGHGERIKDKPIESIVLNDYVDCIVQSVEQGDLDNVIIVGHSMAGISIPAAVAQMSERIARVVMLSTAQPAVGKSMNDLLAHPLSPVSRGVSADFDLMFCNDVDEETKHWMIGNLCQEPPGPMGEPVTVAQIPSNVAASYVLLERDEALPPDFQLEQAQTAGVTDIVRINAGHSVFASQPDTLATLLLEYVS